MELRHLKREGKRNIIKIVARSVGSQLCAIIELEVIYEK